MFESILSQSAGTLSITSALICMGTSIILGLIIACVHMYTTRYTKNFLITLSVLPVMVQVVIMMVNGMAIYGYVLAVVHLVNAMLIAVI